MGGRERVWGWPQLKDKFRGSFGLVTIVTDQYTRAGGGLEVDTVSSLTSTAIVAGWLGRVNVYVDHWASISIRYTYEMRQSAAEPPIHWLHISFRK